jgi:hypothetical protein
MDQRAFLDFAGDPARDHSLGDMTTTGFSP